MKRLDKAFIFVFAVIISYAIFMLYQENQSLISRLEEKDRFIEKSLQRDSIYFATDTETEQEKEKYINGCGIEIGGKEVSTSQLVKILSKSFSENDSLKHQVSNLEQHIKALNKHEDTLHKAMATYQDSAHVYKNIVKALKRDLGIVYKVEHSKNKEFYIKRQPSKVDTALALYPHYKHKISRDPDSKGFKIILDEQLKKQSVKN